MSPPDYSEIVPTTLTVGTGRSLAALISSSTANTIAVLAEAGYGADEIENLLASGAINAGE